jgi:pimeloyl-ACP methyl ester carboxylesterase
MQPPVRRIALAFLALAAFGVGPFPGSAGAQIAFTPCANGINFACGHLTVPLDPSGATPGALTLAIRRRRAPVGNPSSAVVALAGGPGQAAIPFAGSFTAVLGSILSTRDLIVFDQRGTGLSHPLSCHGFERPGAFRSFGALIGACAGQIGAERAFYTTPDSVADIEAIRQAGGYEKLVLYGTSYGTKLALEYAQEHPEHVEALILDSVVTPDGPDPLGRPTLAAVPRILRQLCAFHGCEHITPDPVRDLSRLVQRMRLGPVSGRLIDGHGHAHTLRISSDYLLEILLEGDFDPILRAEFIAAVRAADRGDDAALARLLARAIDGGGGGPSQDIDVPLYYATTCEELNFPWSRAASPHARIAQAVAQAGALPASAFAPFTARNALDLGDLRTCAYWPFATAGPPAQSAPLPNVPTLILSGADDLRTPTSGARAVAAQIPDAHLLVVPNTGHSVLSAESMQCARKALRAQFAARTISPCSPEPPSPFLRPTPLPPERLAAVAPAHGYRGHTGRTLQAVTLTIADFARQFLLQLLETIGSSHSLSVSSLRIGGLHAGWAELGGGGLRFHDYTYVPGVDITGTVKAGNAKLRIGGAAAAHGTLRLGPHRSLVGVLAGRHVRLAGSPGAAGGTTAVAARADRRRETVAARMPASLARLGRLLSLLPAGLGERLAVLPDLWAARANAAL